MVWYRLKFFEGERIDLGAKADITDFVLPYIEEAEKRGIERRRNGEGH